jgi:hypothetical protein
MTYREVASGGPPARDARDRGVSAGRSAGRPPDSSAGALNRAHRISITGGQQFFECAILSHPWCLLTLVREILIVASAKITSVLLFMLISRMYPGNTSPACHSWLRPAAALLAVHRQIRRSAFFTSALRLTGYSRPSPALTLARISGSAGTHFGGPTPAGREEGIRLRGSAGASAPEAGAGPGCKRASRSWPVPGSSGGVVTVRHRCHPGTSRALRTLRNVASAAMPLRLAPRPPFRLHPESTSPSRH